MASSEIEMDGGGNGEKLAQNLKLIFSQRLDWMTPAGLTVVLLAAAAWNFLLFHTLAELFTIVIGVLSFVVAWHTYPFTRNNFLMYLGCAYFWIGGLDLAHTLVYKGMNIYNTDLANPSTQLWISTRYLEAFVLITCTAYLKKPLNRQMAFFAFAAAAAVIYTLVHTGNFPTAFIEGTGLTPFKIYSEYIIVLILSASVYLIWTNKALMPQQVWSPMILAIILTMVAELAFTFYVSVYGLSNLVGHILKLFSFWVIFIAIIRTTLNEPFKVMAAEASSYDAVPDSAIVVDEHCIIRQVNMAAVEQTGSDRETLLGRHCHDHFHPASIQIEDCEICSCITDGTDMAGAELEFEETGQWFDFSLSHIHGESGRRGTVHVQRDITMRKHAEEELLKSYELLEERVEQRTEELRESEKNISSIIKSVGEGIISVDSSGAIILVNEELCRIFNFGEDELIGKSVEILMPERYRAPHHQGFNSYISGKPSKIVGDRIEITGLRKTGEEFPMELRIESAVSESGEVHLTGAIRDITSRVIAEEELLKAKEKAEKANSLKDKFVAMVAHDLRSPFTSILGLMHLLNSDKESNLSEEQKKILEAVVSNGEHMSNMIDELLDSGRLEEGEINPRKQLIDTFLLSNTIIGNMKFAADKKEVKLINGIRPGEKIYGDVNLVTEVLLNLVSNSIKFSTGGGEVTIFSPDGGGKGVAVKDTGEGIINELLPDIFNRDVITTTKGTAGEKGIGLGLPHCHDIMQAHGGELKVESTEGEGSVFYALFPSRKD